MVELVLTRKAQKFYQQAPPDLAQRLNRCFDQLCQDPYNSTNIKSLKGEFAVSVIELATGESLIKLI